MSKMSKRIAKSQVVDKNVKRVSGKEQAPQDENEEKLRKKEAKPRSAELKLITNAIKTTSTKTKDMIIADRGFEMKNQLGAGTYGTVYKALKGDQVFACKVIDTSKRKRQSVNDLKNELFVLRNVMHENLIKLFEHFMIDDKVYVFLEYAAKGTLSDYVKRNGPLSESRSKTLFRQMVGAVHHMHKKGISHRDLKLQNMLMNDREECKVTDFGLSRLSYKPSKGIIYCNKYSGTEPYMAPEIMCLKFKTGKEAKNWLYDPMVADIWALGVCLYNMLNCAYPFDAEDKELMLANQLNRKWKFLRQVRSKMSEEVKDLMRHLLNPEVMVRVSFHCINAHRWLNTDAGEEKSTK